MTDALAGVGGAMLHQLMLTTDIAVLEDVDSLWWSGGLAPVKGARGSTSVTG